MKISVICRALILLYSSTSIRAQEADFNDYVHKVHLNNPALQAAVDRAQAAHERTGYADKLPNPVVQIGRFIEPVQTRTGPQETVLSLSQTLPWFGVRYAQRNSAEALAKSIRANGEAFGLSLIRSLASRFYEYAYTGKATELTEENLDLLRSLEPVVEARVAAGGSLNALLRLKVETGKLEDHLHRLNARREELSSQLDALLNEQAAGLRPWPSWEPPQSSHISEDEEFPRLLQNNAGLAALQKEVNAAESDLRLSELKGKPSFSVGVNYIQLGDPTTSGSQVVDEADPWSVMVGFQIPLWRGAERARQADAQKRLDEKAHLTQSLTTQLRAELSAKVTLHADAIRRLKVYGEELLGLARQAVANSRSGYENGNTSVLELIDSERSLLSLELDYWRAAADAHIHSIHVRTLTAPDLQTFISEEQ